MQVRGNRRRRGLDRGFALSDHADWPGLLAAIEATGAERVSRDARIGRPADAISAREGARRAASRDRLRRGGRRRRSRAAAGGRAVRAFADLYRRLDSATSTRAKQAALVDAFAAAKDDPVAMGERGLDGLFPRRRQAAPDRSDPPPAASRGRRLGAAGMALRGMLLTASAISPRRWRSSCPRASRRRRSRSTSGCASACCRCPRSTRRSGIARLKRWVDELPADQRLAFFKLITGELRVGVSRLQVVKALAEVAGVEESRMAQRMIGYAQARRAPSADDFEALVGEVEHAEAQALDAGRPYPFYLAQSWQGPVAAMQETLGPPAGLDRRMEIRRHSRAAPQARRRAGGSGRAARS